MSDVRNFINKLNEMPAMPHVMVKALNIIRDENSGVNDLAKIMSYDTALTTQVLKIVNSAYYGFAQQITSIQKALPLLGMVQAKNIIVTAAMKSMMTTQGGKDLWKHSIRCGVGCEIIAREMNLMDANDAFVVGFLHDIGKTILNMKNSSAYSKVQELTAKGIDIIETENLILGINHAEIGSMLAKKWDFPVLLTNCIKYHHQPQASMMSSIVYIVYMVDRLVQEQLPNPLFDPNIMKTVAIDLEDPLGMREKIMGQSEALLTLF